MTSRLSSFYARFLRPYIGGIASHYASHPVRMTVGLGKALAAAHVFWMYAYATGSAVGPSMLPTFEVVGHSFVISRWHRFGRGVQVGDLVVYTIPSAPDAEGLKRVIGMPGDYVLLNSPDSVSDEMMQVGAATFSSRSHMSEYGSGESVRTENTKLTLTRFLRDIAGW